MASLDKSSLDNLQMIVSIISAFSILPKALNSINYYIGKFQYSRDHKELDKIEELLKTGTLSDEAIEYLKEQQNRIVFRLCYNIDVGPEMRRVLHQFQHHYQSEVDWPDLRTAYTRMKQVKQNKQESIILFSYGFSDKLYKILITFLVWYTKLLAYALVYFGIIVAFGEIKIDRPEPRGLFVLIIFLSAVVCLVFSSSYKKMLLTLLSLKKVNEIIVRINSKLRLPS